MPHEHREGNPRDSYPGTARLIPDSRARQARDESMKCWSPIRGYESDSSSLQRSCRITRSILKPLTGHPPCASAIDSGDHMRCIPGKARVLPVHKHHTVAITKTLRKPHPSACFIEALRPENGAFGILVANSEGRSAGKAAPRHATSACALAMSMPTITDDPDMVFISLPCACLQAKRKSTNHSGVRKTGTGPVRNRLKHEPVRSPQRWSDCAALIWFKHTRRVAAGS